MHQHALMSGPHEGLVSASLILDPPSTIIPVSPAGANQAQVSVGTLPSLLNHLVDKQPEQGWHASRAKGQGPLLDGLRRVLDIAVAASALVLLAPILAVTAGLVRLTLGGPILCVEEKVGLGLRPFRRFKFRTMAANADGVLERSLENDPKVSCLGNVLRQSGLDELPQLLNVLRGDMSLLGPTLTFTERT